VPLLFDITEKLTKGWAKVLGKLGLAGERELNIFAYKGFGRPDYFFLSGRVLRNSDILRKETDRFWHNMVNNFRRFNSREVAGAELEIEFQNLSFKTVSDPEGYFLIEQTLDPPIAELQKDDLWYKADAYIRRAPGRENLEIYEQLHIMIPSPNAAFGVISDIDDTILKTDVTSLFKLRTLYLTLIKNAGSRKAFQQVSAFYRALQAGLKDGIEHPFFYVSNSPWNLYDLLAEFLDLNELPKGPILLRDFGLPYQDRPAEYRGHKYEQIVRLMKIYPDLPFVLVGDSGEKDVDVYLSIAVAHPGRVKAIYIRDVLHLRRAERVKNLIGRQTDIPVLLVRQYEEAALHAASLDLIDMERFNRFNR
jgi:phosphatidate phosphatase APP1